MYRDNSLMPKEAVRLAALGLLAQSGPQRYGDLAAAVRHFTGRIVGPSLDLMGTSLEMLRYDGLVEASDGTGMEDNALLGITERGLNEFQTLMLANVRSPSSDDINKLVIALKLRFLYLLPQTAQAEQIDGLVALYEAELARLTDLVRRHADDPGLLADWLRHDIEQVEARLAWFQTQHRRITS